MVRAWLVPALLVVLMAPSVRAADADKVAEAAAAFQSLYGPDLDRLKASRDPKESVGLATKLLAAAKKAVGQPEFVAVLCEKACELALAHSDGYAIAVEAVQLEAAAVPEKAAACADRLVEVRQKLFDLAKGDARPSAGETLINALLAAADERQKAQTGGQAGAAADAMAYHKRALIVARAVKSDRVAALESNVKAAEQAGRLAAEIESLKKLIVLEPQNQAARQRLVRLHLVDYDDPAEAARLLEGVEDATLLKFAPAAAKPLETVPEFACLELGEWYRSLADAAPPAAKPLMFARAKAYCERFLQLHTAEDINRTKAALLLQKIADAIQAAGATTPRPVAPTPAPRPGGKTVKNQEWIDLLAMVDLQKDALSGEWQREGTSIAPSGPGGSPGLKLPVAVDGSFELEVKFARSSGKGPIKVVFPVGSSGVALVLGKIMPGKSISGLARVKGKWASENETTVSPCGIQTGRVSMLLIKVLVSQEQSDITIELDGAPFIRWKGATKALGVDTGNAEESALLTSRCAGLISENSLVVCHSARLRMLSGEAKLLHAAAK